MIVKLFYLVTIVAIVYLLKEANGKSIKLDKLTKQLLKEFSEEETLKNNTARIGKYLGFFGNAIEAIPMLYKSREEMVSYLKLLTFDDEETCRQLITFKLFTVFVGALAAGVFTAVIFATWYMTVGVTGIIFFLGYKSLSSGYKKKINKLYLQLPDALQIFSDNYLTNSNVKTSLDATASGVQGDIAVLFQKLSRSLSSGEDAEIAINKFADDLDYFWGYAFAQLLTIAITTSGDITQDINFLINAINTDVKEELETMAAISSSKTLINGLNGAGALGLLAEITFLDFARDFYLYASTGSLILLAFLAEIVICNIGLTLMEDL